MNKKVIAITAIILSLAVFVPNLNAQWTNPVNEDFNGSWGTYANNPPAGWTINYSGTANRNDWYRYYWSHTSSYSARIYWSPSETGIDELISPIFDCSSADQVYVAATHYYNHYSGSYTSQWRGSIDGGSTFPYVLYDYYASTTGPTRDSLLFPEAAGEANVCINFYGDGYTWNMNYWYIDDVAVWIHEGGGPSEDSLDLIMLQVIRPADQMEGGSPFVPACRIYNPADSVVEAEIRCNIKDLELQQTVYEDVLGAYPLDPGNNAVEAFKSFTPEGNKNYEALFVLSHPDDANEQNNDKDKRFSTSVGEEVTPVVMIAPASPDQYNAFMPKASYVERAGAESTDATLFCVIEDGTYMAEVYRDSTEYTFSAGDSVDIEFAEAAGLADGSYTITFWATDVRGADISDPRLIVDFTYIGVDEEPVAERFGLTASSNNVSFSLPSATTVNLRVYDIAGNVVADLASGIYSAGTHDLNFNANPGVYFVKMITPEFNATEKLIILTR